MDSILAQIKSEKWSWAAHVRCRTENRWTTKTMEWLLTEGNKSKGNPTTRWTDEVRKFGQLEVDERGLHPAQNKTY